MKKLQFTEKRLIKTQCKPSYIDSVRVVLSNLIEYEGDFNPYKIPLIITSAAALDILGEDHKFVTRIYSDGKIDSYGNLDGKR